MEERRRNVARLLPIQSPKKFDFLCPPLPIAFEMDFAPITIIVSHAL